MTAAIDRDVFPIRGGWRVRRPDGTMRTVLRRLDPDSERYAVVSGDSTDDRRDPPLGYSNSWRSLDVALDLARVHQGDV